MQCVQICENQTSGIKVFNFTLVQLQQSSDCPSFSSTPNLFIDIAQGHASLHMRRILIWDSTATQCLAIFWLIHQPVLKVKKDLLAVDWSVEMEWNHSQSFHVISKANIFWLLLIWPRSMWTIPKVGSKKKPTTYFIPDPINNSNLSMSKIQVHLPAEWLPFIIRDVITSIVLSVHVCHSISKLYFRDWRRHHFPYCRAVAQTTGWEKWYPDKRGRATLLPTV